MLAAGVAVAAIVQAWQDYVAQQNPQQTPSGQPAPSPAGAEVIAVTATGIAITAAMAAHWLKTSTSVDGVYNQALTTALDGVWTDGYAIGRVSAITVARHQQSPDHKKPVPTPDWGTWEPGDYNAARMLIGADGAGGLQQLLHENNATIPGITGNRIDRLGRALADAYDKKLTGTQLAASLNDIITDPIWAHQVAITELNRATSAATMATYRSIGLTKHEWATAEDQRVCPVCDSNADASPIDIGTPFPGGVLYPPQHPGCRCALIPAMNDSPEQE